MSRNLDAKLAALQQMSAVELRAEWTRQLKAEPPKITAELMRLAIGYRLQERALGGLSARCRRKLLAPTGRGAALPVMKPGTRLLRSWNGRTIEVLVTDEGYEHENRSYRSLSQIAREVTGTAWSGPRFFGLNANA
ncbi:MULTISPECIES: DUF2924 domain-containing protein [Sphingomonas]|uniref:DUF2924 domain-containing protein n=1 Tax=Sphingomonas TaxID=13687 RepID=UPI000DEF4B90|nr:MULTISPECIES: DUF2924 domain-containing protein [Sphingomonas]